MAWGLEWDACLATATADYAAQVAQRMGECATDSVEAAANKIAELARLDMGILFPASEWTAAICTLAEAWRCHDPDSVLPPPCQ